MRLKINMLMLVSLISFVTLPTSIAASQQNKNNWSSDAYESLKNAGYLQDFTFNENEPITRGEFAQLIYQTLNIEHSADAKFSDVSENDRYYNAIAALAELHILNGFDDGSFQPDKHLTRAQAAAIITNSYNVPNATSKNPFADVAPNHWALQHINALHNANIINGVSAQHFAPDKTLTWAEAITIVHRALQVRENNANLASTTDEPANNFSEYTKYTKNNNEKLEIIEAKSLSRDGHYIEVTFNQPLKTIDTDHFYIYDSKSLHKHGIEDVYLTRDGKKAVITFFTGAGLDTLREYTIEYKYMGAESSYTYYENEYIYENNVTITDVDILDREITIKTKKDITFNLTVPETMEFDFVDAYNRKARVWYNRKGELTLFELTNEADDVKKGDKFISQYTLNDFIYVQSLKDSIVNDVFDLEHFNIFVKSHQMIEKDDINRGDLLLYNWKDKVLQVCTNIVHGTIEGVYLDGIEVDDKYYDYNGYYLDRHGDLEVFDLDRAEELYKRKVTIFLSNDDKIVFVK